MFILFLFFSTLVLFSSLSAPLCAVSCFMVHNHVLKSPTSLQILIGALILQQAQMFLHANAPTEILAA